MAQAGSLRPRGAKGRFVKTDQSVQPSQTQVVKDDRPAFPWILVGAVALALVLGTAGYISTAWWPSIQWTQPDKAVSTRTAASPTPSAKPANTVRENIVVRTDQGPVQGVVIRLIPATGDPITATTGPDGTATAEFTPGKYLVTATKDGIETVFLVNVDLPVKDGLFDLKSSPKGGTPPPIPADNQSARVILSGVKTVEDGILVALAHGQAGGGINSRDQIVSTNANATIPASGTTYYRNGILVAMRPGTDAGKGAIEIVTKDGRHIFVQKECGNLVVPSSPTPASTPVVQPTTAPTPVIVPTPTPTPVVVVPTPTPAPASNYSVGIGYTVPSHTTSTVTLNLTAFIAAGTGTPGYNCTWTINGSQYGSAHGPCSLSGVTEPQGTVTFAVTLYDATGYSSSVTRSCGPSSSPACGSGPAPAPTPQPTPVPAPSPSSNPNSGYGGPG